MALPEAYKKTKVAPPKPKAKTKAKQRGRPPRRASLARKSSKANPIVIDDSDEESARQSDHEEEDPYASFPIVVTTYEMIIKDRVHLAKFNWGYIVVDEGHRLKNLDCTLMREIKKYPSAGRMILTGTPLHVSLLSRGYRTPDSPVAVRII